jgi:hypothetical protein
MNILLRFIFGLILAVGLALRWQEFSLPAVVAVVVVGVTAAVWGDKFILGFMSFMRYFR